MILHDGPNYRVRFRRSSDDPLLVVSFEYWMPGPQLDGPFAGEEFFVKRGINVVGIKVARNDWYQHDEIHAALGAILAATPGMRRVGYGASMGAFAAINFAAELSLHSLVAVCPQYSVDPAKAPFETRWPKDAAKIEFRNDQIGTIPRLTCGSIVFDPHGLDGQHAALILAHHDLRPIKVRFGGHSAILMLQQTGLYSELLIDLVTGNFDHGDFVRRLRVARRGSAVCWIEVSGALRGRNRLDAALRCALIAKELPHPERYSLDANHAETLWSMGRRDEAIAMITPYFDDPGWSELAHWDLYRWQSGQ